MGLYDFLFGPTAGVWGNHLQQYEAAQRVRGVRARQQVREASAAQRRIKALEEDVGFLALVIGSVLETLDRKGVLTRDEVKSELARLDALDGVKEGRLDVRVLRGKTS